MPMDHTLVRCPVCGGASPAGEHQECHERWLADLRRMYEQFGREELERRRAALWGKL